MWRILMSSKNFQNIQFILSFIFGWFVLGNVWISHTNINIDKTDLFDKSLDQCNCPRVQCEPCDQVTENEEEIEKRNDEIVKGSFRSNRYKPQSVAEDEVNRWRLLTNKYHYEIINQEPICRLNGMWEVELNDVDKKAKEFLREYELKHRTKPGVWKLEELYRHYDPFHGMEYIANYLEKSTKERHTVELRRPFLPGRPRLVSIEYAANDEIINIISPISKVSERFNLFFDRYESNVLADPKSGPIRLLFVVFQSEDGRNHFNDEAVGVVDRFKQRNPAAKIDYIFVKGEFNRAVGLHTGVKHCQNDEIVLFLDIDMIFGSDFLGRVRRNTLRGKRVMFPFVYSQYDPDVMDKASDINPDIKPLTRDKMAINKETGFWIYYGYGIAAMYKSDYLKVGGFRLDIKGWGGEDVDLFEKMVADKDLDVMTAVDNDLIHIYHSRGCDVKLASDQYKMCVGSWVDMIGSQVQLATLYLDHHKDEV